MLTKENTLRVVKNTRARVNLNVMRKVQKSIKKKK